MSLEEQLAAIHRDSQKTIPARIMEVITKQVEDLSESDIPQQCAKPGDIMPDLEVLDTQENAVPLSELWAKGPVILSFYRGGW